MASLSRLGQALLVSIVVFNFARVSASVKVVSNGYEEVVVAIGADVAQDDQLITAIRQAWTSASSALYRATNRRLFFRKITIVVPATWSTAGGYPSAALRATFRNAQFRVTSSSVPGLTRARTETFGFGCGREGRFVHIPPARLSGGLGTVSFHFIAHFVCRSRYDILVQIIVCL